MSRLRWHQREGHTVAFVSASLGCYLRPLAERLGVEHVLCTELEVGTGDRLTGRMMGSNCRGQAKVDRLAELFGQRRAHRLRLRQLGGRPRAAGPGHRGRVGGPAAGVDGPGRGAGVTIAPVAPASTQPSSVGRGIWRTMRPKQWSKNLLVFAAPGAAGLLGDPLQLFHASAAFVSFCAASSAAYLVNDAADVESDRRHPIKRNRPIAAGIVPVPLARWVAAGLVLVAFAVMGLTGQPMAVGYVAIYLAITFAYSAGLKRIAVIDLLIVASGFVLRALAGAVAVDVYVSDWFLIVTTFGSLFVVAGKRFAEIREVGADAETRATLETYTVPYLRMIVGVGLTGTAISYCLFAFERATQSTMAFPAFKLSILPVLAALLRYALVLEAGQGGAPEEVFASDRWLQVLGLSWAVLFAIGVYGK